MYHDLLRPKTPPRPPTPHDDSHHTRRRKRDPRPHSTPSSPHHTELKYDRGGTVSNPPSPGGCSNDPNRVEKLVEPSTPPPSPPKIGVATQTIEVVDHAVQTDREENEEVGNKGETEVAPPPPPPVVCDTPLSPLVPPTAEPVVAPPSPTVLKKDGVLRSLPTPSTSSFDPDLLQVWLR